jgi:2-polyprenyl-3-methyl-5-hydroxy-6-metoxy-1,4-benzoquinol methylase
VKQRSNQAEILDDPAMPSGDLEASLNMMVHVNRFFGGAQAIKGFFKREAKEKSFSVLDLGTGSGDIPYHLARWARQEGKRIKITAIDTNDDCLAYAKRRFACPEVQYLKHSAFGIKELGSFDYVMASMFFHHLKDKEILDLLTQVHQVMRKGFIINDLYRGYGGLCGAALLSSLSFNRVVFHDATVSVKRAFRREDYVRYQQMLGLNGVQIKRKPFFRIVMSYLKDASHH